MAGMAIEASMLGAAHALANPLTANFSIPHGQAVGMMMPHVVRFNAQLPEIESLYKELASSISDRDEKPGELIASWFTTQLQLTGLKTRLSELNIHEPNLGELALQASKQWTATFNPHKVDVGSLQQMYEKAQ